MARVGLRRTRARRCSPASPPTSVLPLEPSDHERVRRDAGRPGPRRGLAVRRGRIAVDHRRARHDPLRARRRGRQRAAGRARCPSCRRRGSCWPTSRPAAGGDRRRPAAGAVRAPVAPVPPRAGRLQGRLRARRAGAVDGRRRRAGGHGPPRRDDRRGRGGRGAPWRAASTPSAPFVLVAQQSACSTRRGRPAGQAHALGLLPRAVRLDGRHDRRASRPRSSGSPPGSGTW